ncbi:MAG TPA: ATP-binding cassette domain-containing protein, partial [bacterium]|nr:ATP-binding cassette domain-containing protein [bacterium]
KALDNINIEINRGELVFLTGASGSGKTTFLQLIYRGIYPTAGEIYVENQEITELPDRKVPMIRKKIGVVFQDFKLLYKKTVFENVAYIMKIMNEKKSMINLKTENILKEVGLWYKKDYLPHTLSAGEQQRLSIARALVNNPPIILADEPTGNLDFDNALNVMELFKKLHYKAATIIIVTHNLELPKLFNGRHIKLIDGSIVYDSIKDNTNTKQE